MMTTNDPKPLKGNNINDYLFTAPTLSLKERRYGTHYFPRHFFPDKRPSWGVSISRLLKVFS